jgi:hypothetical protein
MVLVLMLILLYAEARTGLLASFMLGASAVLLAGVGCTWAAGGSALPRRSSAACWPIPCGAGAAWSRPSATWTPN